MGRDHSSSNNSKRKHRRSRPKFKGPDVIVTPSLTIDDSSSTVRNNPLFDGSTPISEENVSDLITQLASTDPIAREHAIVVAGAIFSRPSKIAEELLGRDGSLEAIVDALHASGSECVRVRCSAAETLSNLLEWLQEEKVVLLANGLSVIECCLGCLIEESSSLKTSTSSKQIDDVMCSIQKCFELLTSLSQFDEIITSILTSFQSSGPEGTIRDVAFTFASGLPNGSLGLASPPRSAAAITAYSSAANFVACVVRAAKQRSSDSPQAVRSAATQLLLSTYAPLVATLNDMSTHGYIKTIETLFLQMKSDNNKEGLQMNVSVIQMWIVYTIDAVIQLIEFVNHDKPLDAPIPNLPISLNNCVPLLLSCLSPEAYTSVAGILDRIESQNAESAGKDSAPSTAESTPTALEDSSASCSPQSAVKVRAISLEKGEKFEDSNEIAIAQQAEAELRLVMNRLLINGKCLRLLDGLTDNSCLETQVMGALDLPSASLLTSSLESALQQTQQSSINQQALMRGWSIIMSTLTEAIQSITNLTSQIPIFTSSERLWDLFTTLVDALTALLHFCGSVLSAQNAPSECLTTFQRSDLFQGSFSALLTSGELLQLLLQSTSNSAPPLSASLSLIELVEAVVHMSNEVTNRFPSPVPEPIEPSEVQSVQTVVTRIADLLQTPTSSLVSAIATTLGKKPSPNKDKKSMEEDDDDELSEWRHRELADCVDICESIWPDIHLQLIGLNSTIGMRWRKEGVLKIILSRSLTLLEERSTAVSVRAAVLDSIFDMFGDEDFDSLFIELKAVQRLEEIWKRIRATMKKMKKMDEGERFQVQAAVQNLQAFISYKKSHIVN